MIIIFISHLFIHLTRLFIIIYIYAVYLPKLDTLFLLTSKGDVQQSVGRIQRKHEYTENDNIPLIVDIVDNFSIFENQLKKRKAFYKKMNYTIFETISSE